MAQAVTLKNVRNFLYPVRLKWYDLGIELDIPGEKLDEIKSKNREDYGACLRDMIAARLKFKDDPLHIEDALHAKAINEPQLADESWERSASCITHYESGTESFFFCPSVPTCPAQPSWKFLSITRRPSITDLPCYHGGITGVEAEEKLKQQPGDSHLIRYSEIREEFILSVSKGSADEHICQHFVINTKQQGFTVQGSDVTFHDPTVMLKYFRSNPIIYEINSIGEPCHVTRVELSPAIHTEGGSLQEKTSLGKTSTSAVTRNRRCCFL